MSRNYEMSIKITKFNPKKLEAIQDAAGQEWPFEDWSFWPKNKPKELLAFGRSQLAGGENDEEFSRRLAKAVMKANGKPCNVEIGATYLDDLPCDYHSFGKDEYEDLMKENPS